MFYDGAGREGCRACLAESNDLKTWVKKGAIGMPTVIQVGDKLAMPYDGVKGESTSPMRRDIGLAWMQLPLVIR